MTIRERTFALILVAVMVATVAAAAWLTQSAPRVPFRTGRAVYLVGDVVGFTLTNTWNMPIHLSSTAPWMIERWISGAWHAVESHADLMVIVTIAPAEARNWSWRAVTQDDHPDLAPVKPGAYRITMETWYGCSERFEGCSVLSLTTSFSLL